MNPVPRIWLDNCALMRLFDASEEPRVLAEVEVIEQFLAMTDAGLLVWVAGEVNEIEIRGNPDAEIRSEAERLMQKHVGSWLELTELSLARAVGLGGLGYDAYDALHLVSAEQASVDVLLTTDDRLCAERYGV